MRLMDRSITVAAPRARRSASPAGSIARSGRWPTPGTSSGRELRSSPVCARTNTSPNPIWRSHDPLMSGSWLRQMGFGDVFVLAQTGDERSSRPDEVPGVGQRPDLAIDPAGLADLLARGAATVIDLSISRIYRRGHIPGAWFAIRARLEQALNAVPARESFVL